MYQGEDYDLAGFCVGVVEKDRIIDGTGTRAGDAIIGLASSGPHSNGYSLIRKLVEIARADADTLLEGLRLFDRLLAPTRIYVKPVLALLSTVPVHGIAHITGGGLLENIPRVVPDGLEVRLQRGRWPRDPIFDWLQSTGAIPDEEMQRTFNCGIGMTVCVPASHTDAALATLRGAGADAMVVGEVRSGSRGVVIEA
jgi:phosphoribosylformylglycinamidine cyclo-ligase